VAGLEDARHVISDLDFKLSISACALQVYTIYTFATGVRENGMGVYKYLYLGLRGDIADAAFNGLFCRGGSGWVAALLRWPFLFAALVLGGFAPLAVPGFTVAKLFPPPHEYACSTRLCARLVHNAAMTLASCAFDVAEVHHAHALDRADLQRVATSDPDDLSTLKVLYLCFRPLLKLCKAGSLVCSIVWVAFDLAQVSPVGRFFAPRIQQLG
jgi:hypothetical protein